MFLGRALIAIAVSAYIDFAKIIHEKANDVFEKASKNPGMKFRGYQISTLIRNSSDHGKVFMVNANTRRRFGILMDASMITMVNLHALIENRSFVYFIHFVNLYL